MKRPLRLLLFVILFLGLSYTALWFTSWRPFLPGYRWWQYTPAQYTESKKNFLLRKAKLGINQVEEARHLLVNGIDSVLFPYWEGTRWSFNGTTEVPGTGRIACGYFVTTMLRDAGVRLNRRRMSQAASEPMIRSLVQPGQVNLYVHKPAVEFFHAIRNRGDQLYVLGLDTHTGFLLCEKGNIWFIHSGGANMARVQKQPAEEAPEIVDAAYRVTGCLTADTVFLKKWISGAVFDSPNTNDCIR